MDYRPLAEGGDYAGDAIDEEIAPFVQEAIDAANARGWTDGIDDLLLLQRLLEVADDNVLRAMGSRAKTLLREVDRMLADDVPRPVPDVDDLLRFAMSEAYDLSYSSQIGAIHLLLALFAFRGAASEAVLQQVGIDWRPLRSIVRRLGLGW